MEKELPLPALPSQETLVTSVRESLDKVASNPAQLTLNAGWSDAIGNALKERLAGPGIELNYGRDRRIREDQREWLFDVCVGLFAERDTEVERYLTQALIVGEVEWQRGLDRDFEKLMIVDSLVCFFAFPEWVADKEKRPPDYWCNVARQRVEFITKKRGTNPPPVFVISSYSKTRPGFAHRVVGKAPSSSSGWITDSV